MGDRKGVRSTGDRLAVLQSIVSATFSVLPPFLVGALAVSLRSELGFGPEALGGAVAWFFVTTATVAPKLGRSVERLGVRASLVVGAAGSALSLLGVAVAPGYILLLAALTVGGVANAILQPAVNASLSHRIPGDRLGLAIGIKQSSIPTATLLGGLAVPTLGVTIGWRWTFAAAALLAAANGLVAWCAHDDGPATPGRVTARPRRVHAIPHQRSLLILTAGGFLAAAAATTLGAFLVDGGVAIGLTEASAGLLFAWSSVFGLVTRVAVGWAADHFPTRSRYGTITAMLLVGAPGFLLLASEIPAAYAVGAFLAYGAGWGWPGLFHFTVVSQYPSMPAAATGMIQSGVAAGAGLGPLVFGFIAGMASYEAAWRSAGLLCLVSAGLFLIGREHLRRSLRSGVHQVQPPALPDSPTTAEPDPLAPGVTAVTVPWEGRTAVFMRLAPTAIWTGRVSEADAAMVVLVEGAGLALEVGGRVLATTAGAAFELPTSLLWTARNLGSSTAVIAILPQGPS